MPAENRSNASPQRPANGFAPRLYYFHPLEAGPLAGWVEHFRRAREMGFDSVLMAPVFASGADGDLFLAADHDRPHPAISAPGSVDELMSSVAEICRQHGLLLYVDVVLGRLAPDAALVANAPHVFRIEAPSTERIDPRASHDDPHAAYGRFDDPAAAQQLADWWIDRLRRLTAAGVAGFGCRDPHLVPALIWHKIIAGVREGAPASRFLAWTPGLTWPQISALRGAGFDAAFSSVAWWDGRAAWLLDEYELLRQIGAVIGAPEAPFGPRLAASAQARTERAAGHLQHMVKRAVVTGDGLLMPAGFEFAADRAMSRHAEGNAAEAHSPAPCTSTLATAIKEANMLAQQLAELKLTGPMRLLTGPGRRLTALFRSDAPDIRQTKTGAVVAINSDLREPAPLSLQLTPLPAAAGAALTADQIFYRETDSDASLDAGEIRIFRARPTALMTVPSPRKGPTDLSDRFRVVIENVAPSVDRGRFAARRVIGQAITVEADVFTDGHGRLAADAMWRAVDERKWRRVEMEQTVNDRWQASFIPERVGRYEFTVEAWFDRYGTFSHELELKHKAGADIHLEIAEGRELLERAHAEARASESETIQRALTALKTAAPDDSVGLLLASDLRESMRALEQRAFVYRNDPPLSLDIERPQAAFSSWYELFPRSATDDLGRHGNFIGTIERLPAIRDMGFDVLYLTPIHPIGRKNRKGKNNSLTAETDDVGSPYAIGGREGGHDAIHPELGSLDDFRRLRDAAHQYGLELALDFAIQCSPDHPWIKEHPEWFDWRPDGSLRYAENPPKKYEDIVNVDFYAPAAIPGLWYALRNIVLFWAAEGIRIFRVDNPHTKPLPFWDWMIADVRSRYTDVIFLSEAFTRPKMMYRLAKGGFSQSYTYFTWRDTKQELTEYFVELTTTEVKEFFRPHLFVNTPDINPRFLQTSGRPGFLIRAALAATLSGLWGIYSGFELCEAAALPGREEYLDSEKYQIRTRDYQAPGNIIGEISRLNRIRRDHPALQSHLGLRFYPAHNDQIIFYGKPLPAEGDMILAAVSLDPFNAQEATIEVPLWEWNLPDDGSVIAHDLMRDTVATWHGKFQNIRLDPGDLPFALWRISPPLGAR